MKLFDPLTLPMTGVQLIEASAGTGKTHSISNLYLRAVLGVGCERALSVQEILVVTFTNAACAELKTRIRQRLVNARSVLGGSVLAGSVLDSADLSGDDFLQQLLDGWSQEQVVEAIVRLELATRSIDEAAIYTIHGFCQRALQDGAFLFGLPFEQQLEEDTGSMSRMLVLDWWRSLGSKLDKHELEWLAEKGKGPFDYKKTLLADIKPDKPLPKVADAGDVQSLINEFRQLWPEARELFVEYKGGHGGRKPFNNLDKYLANMDAFLEEHILDISSVEKLEWAVFSQASLTKNTKKNNQPLQHRAFEIADMLNEMWPAWCLSVDYKMARHYQLLLEQQQQKNLLDFDRLVSLLDEKISSAATHATHLSDLYPVMMVDEFQDTDAAQFRIFSALAQAGSCLLMIGDPKQAIYRFRGADIHAYLKAREGADCYGMDTNWRSTQSLIDAVNFIFNPEGIPPFIYNTIPFEEVHAAGKADKTPFTLNGETQSPLTIHFAGRPARWNMDHSLQFTARDIRLMLDNDARIGDKALSPGEIAVLVKTNGQARDMQLFLRQQGVASILVSDESVFASSVAKHLLFVLHAMLEKDNLSAVSTALAGLLIAWPVEKIMALRSSEEMLAEVQQQFAACRKLWFRYGVSVAVRQVMSAFDIPGQLMALPDGQRHLSDLLHLLELLQKQSRELPGANSLFDWFGKQLVSEDHLDVSDDEKIKLETEHQLVKVVTFHRSKGLQYDVVFIPQLGFSSQLTSDYVYYQQDGKEYFTWSANEEEKAILEQEQLAEDLRLLYVGLTRARYKVQANLFRSQKKIENTAIGYLTGFADYDEEDVEPLLKLEQAGVEVIEHLEAEDIYLVDSQQHEVPQKTSGLSVAEFPVIDTRWRIGSFSSLTGLMAHQFQTALQGAYDEAVGKEEHYPEETSQDIRFSFSKGAETGNFLHSIYEYYLQEEKPQRQLENIIAKQWPRFHLRDDFQQSGTVLRLWLEDSLATPISGGVNLASLDKSACLPEMEFYLPLRESLQASHLQALLENYGYQTSVSLNFFELQGYLKGFIDLVYEAQGQYYVLDYKSNYLGPDFSFYQGEKLREAIWQHHYQLQYVLYTLALHRYLKMNLPSYDYEKHIGGVCYLFLRGMQKDTDETGVYKDRVPFELIKALDELFVQQTSQVNV